MDFSTERVQGLLVFPDASIFGSSENKRFATIQTILATTGIVVGQLVLNEEKVKRWTLLWNDELANLVWNGCTSERWHIASVDSKQKELTGIWKGFDLYEFLEQNGVDLEDYWYNDFIY